MKRFKYIILSGLALIIMSACDSDLDQLQYDAEGAKPATLASIEESYVLDAQNSDKTAISFTWEKPVVNYDASITTTLQMDLAGNNFQTPVVLAATKTEQKYEANTAELNALLMKLIDDRELEFGPLGLEFRLSSSISTAAAALLSNVVSTTVTPFSGEKEYPQVWVIGDFCGWSHDNSQFLYSANDDTNYAGMIYFDGKAANGWKLCAAANWDENWGAGKDVPDEAASLVLAPGGDNLGCYKHMSYWVEFDKATATLKVSKPHDSWGVVGEHNSWGGTPDVAMTLASETDQAGKRQYYLTATLDLEAGKGWKIRPDNAWGDDKGPGQLKYEDNLSDEGGNFVVKESGNYTVKWYFNKVEQRIQVVKN